ncbi:MAG: S-layer homology domain-containing protein [Deltaproteobacteria bacterium]|nr:S-layer homology domain-containing protein [Deltaproteobacteria bacterium]
MRPVLLILAAVLLAAAGACAPVRQGPVGLDTPQHHRKIGRKFLELEKYADALREFTRAKDLQENSLSWMGIALAEAGLGRMDQAMEHLDQAMRYAWIDGHVVEVYTARIRALTMGGDAWSANWLEQAKYAFDRARGMDPDDDAPFFYMGLAYKQGLKFVEAGRLFAAVIQKNGDYAARADKEYAEVQKIRRAKPRSEVGKRIALADRITRAQAAALLVAETDAEALLGGTERDPRLPTDITGHPLAPEIMAAVRLGIDGLSLYPDGSFGPDEPVTRCQFATAVQDFLIRASSRPVLATEFSGVSSPFPDVKKDSPCFNAVMVCTTRGLLQARDLSTGCFAPADAVSGIDALCAASALRSLLTR